MTDDQDDADVAHGGWWPTSLARGCESAWRHASPSMKPQMLVGRENHHGQEDRLELDGDFTQAIEKMFELPECLGAYVSPLTFILTDRVLSDIDIEMGNAKAADRRSNIRMLRKPPDKAGH